MTTTTTQKDRRTPESIIIGKNLKAMRGELTLGQVAHRSGVPERTIQRAEAGLPVRPENLKALADTLGCPVPLLSLDYESKEVKDLLEQGSPIVPLKAVRLLAALDIENWHGGHLFISHKDERLSESALDLAAEIEQSLQDLNDLWEDMSAPGRWEECKRIASELDSLQDLGAALLSGTETLHLRPTKAVPNGAPFILKVVIFLPIEDMRPSVAYDRRALPSYIRESLPEVP